MTLTNWSVEKKIIENMRMDVFFQVAKSNYSPNAEWGIVSLFNEIQAINILSWNVPVPLKSNFLSLSYPLPVETITSRGKLPLNTTVRRKLRRV